MTLETAHPLFAPHDDTLDAARPNLWSYRRIVARQIMRPAAGESGEHGRSDVCLVNWPVLRP